MQEFLKMFSLYWATSPKWKILKVVRNARISQKNGFIVMGNWPKWKMKRVFKEV